MWLGFWYAPWRAVVRAWWVGAILTAAWGCAKGGRSVTHPRSAPAAPEVALAQAYTPKLEHSVVDPAGICTAAPERCPNVELIASTQGLPLSQSGSPGPEILLTGPLSGASAVSQRRDTLLSAASESVSRAESKILQLPGKPRTAPEPVHQLRARHGFSMRDVEAHLEIEVDDIGDTAIRVRSAVEAAGGSVVNEVFEDSQVQHGAALSIRVPVEQTNTLLEQLSELGRVRSRKVQATDISRKYLDAQVLLRNLRATLQRYEELLKKAEDVSDVAGIEAALARLRTQIERVEGDLVWLADAGARSTVYLKLSSAHPEALQVPPEPKLWPVIRAVLLFDLGSAAEQSSFAGAGFAFLFVRPFGFDAAVLKDLHGEGVTLFAASLGGEVYSDYLGAGRRRWLNPYLGFRAGYLHHADLHEAALGVTLGLELLRTDVVMLEAQTRGYAAFASKMGLHPLVESSLGFGVAF